MNISDNVRKCIVFLCTSEIVEDRVEWEPQATAFLVGFPFTDGKAWHYYLVTATHNINKIREKGSSYAISINKKEGGKQFVEKTDVDGWIGHTSADVSVMHFDVNLDDYDIAHMPATWFENLIPDIIRKAPIGGRKDLELGMDVFIPGLFSQYRGSEERNIPIIRTGHIAMYPLRKSQAKVTISMRIL